MRAISMPRVSRTVIDATTSSRASLSLTLLRRMSRIDMPGPPSLWSLVALSFCALLASSGGRRYAAGPADRRAGRKLSMNYTTDFKSIRGQVSAEEWQARVDLAACYRLVDKYGMTDLIYNHITARIPGGADHLLINLYG